MKFKTGDILYYVNPFVFTIEKVLIKHRDEFDNRIAYIESNGGYLEEKDLYRTLNEAKLDARAKLQKFVNKKNFEISNINPELIIEE